MGDAKDFLYWTSFASKCYFISFIFSLSHDFTILNDYNFRSLGYVQDDITLIDY